MFLCSLCRAKLAEWLASKGKSFKRPALTTAEPSRTKVSAKPEAVFDPQRQSHVGAQPAAQRNPEPEPRLEAHKPDSAAATTAAHCANTQGAALTTHGRTPVIMNTSLDLLEISDVDPQDSVDDVRKQAVAVLAGLKIFHSDNSFYLFVLF